MDIKYSYYVSSKGFKITEGTAAQFLKADGSVDNNSYVTINTAQNIIAQKTFTQSPVIPDGTVGNHAVTVSQLNKYLPLTGGTIVGNINLQLQNAKVGIGKMNETGDVHVGSSGMTIPSTVISDYGFYLSYNAYRDIDGEWKHSRTTSVNAYVFKGGHHNAGFSWSVSPNVGTANLNLTEIMKLDNVGNLKANSFSIAGGTNAQFLKANGSIDSNSYLTVNQTDAKYIPLSQRGTANGVATLDASVQIPNAQIPQRLLNKVIALGGEGSVDTSFTGLYDRNQLTLADKEHTVTTVLNGAGSFGNPLSTFNSIIFNAKSDFAIINGADSTTELVITINLNSVLNNYSRGYWQAFVQSRLQNNQMFRDISVEVMDNNNVWFPALTATNVVQIPGSGLYLFPESTFGTASIKSIRFKLSNVLTFNGIVYVSNIGFRHIAHSFAPQFPHRGENNKFFGVNDFSLSPTVPTATVANQAVNFGQISSKVNQSDLNNQLANYATLNSVQTFANTNTFTKSPLIPNATLLPHAVNLGTMSSAIEESEGNTIGFVSSNFQSLNTPQNVGASKNYTHSYPFKFVKPNTKTWTVHKPSGNSLIFAPSTVVDSEDWDWPNQVAFYEDGTVEGNKVRVRGGLPTQIMMADGSRSTNFVTTNTSQSITEYKTFEAGAELLLKGDDQNLVQSLKTGNQLGGNIVAGWYYRHYSAIWKAGCIRNSGPLSEGFGFELSNDGGTTFERIFKIQHDSNLVTRDFGRSDQWYDAYLWGNHAQAGYVKLDNNGNISAKGIIHPDYPNDNNLAYMADGGIRDINDFAGTLVKYIEVQAGAAFTPSTDDTHLDVYARGDMELYLTSAGHIQGKKITVYTNNNLSAEVKVYRDGNLVTTIQSGRTTEFILTFTGWIMTEIGSSTFI